MVLRKNKGESVSRGKRCWKDVRIEMLLVKMNLGLGLKTADAFQKMEGNWKT